jgi:hypothetical protein
MPNLVRRARAPSRTPAQTHTQPPPLDIRECGTSKPRTAHTHARALAACSAQRKRKAPEAAATEPPQKRAQPARAETASATPQQPAAKEAATGIKGEGGRAGEAPPSGGAGGRAQRPAGGASGGAPTPITQARRSMRKGSKPKAKVPHQAHHAPPPRLLPAKWHKEKPGTPERPVEMTTALLKRSHEVLHALMGEDMDGIFYKPVDLNQYRGYREQITAPMDFSTVREKLSDSVETTKYATVGAWAEDVRLVLRNCVQYNRTDSPGLVETARSLGCAFEKLLAAAEEDPEAARNRAVGWVVKNMVLFVERQAADETKRMDAARAVMERIIRTLEREKRHSDEKDKKPTEARGGRMRYWSTQHERYYYHDPKTGVSSWDEDPKAEPPSKTDVFLTIPAGSAPGTELIIEVPDIDKATGELCSTTTKMKVIVPAGSKAGQHYKLKIQRPTS